MKKVITCIVSMLMVLGVSAASDKLSVGNYAVTSGETLQMAVSLTNETVLSAFQCDVYLPDGISLAINEDGDLDVTLNAGRVTSSHTVTAIPQTDGTIRIAAYSTSSKSFKGNDGELFYLNLNTDAEVEGEKTVSLRNIIFSTSAAQEVLLEDVVSTVQMSKYVPKNDFVVSDAEVKGGESFLCAVELVNESELAAFQCDIYLPEGLTLLQDEEGDLDVRLNPERATSFHTVMARAQADGCIRVAAYANPTKPFNGNEGVLFYLNLQAERETIGEKIIEIKKVICSTTNASIVPVADVEAVVNVLEAEVLVSSITLGKQYVEVVRGETVTLTATVSPVDADNTALVWNSSDETVATVVDGVVTTLKIGETVITATTTDGSNLSASCTVVSKPLWVSSVTLDKQNVEVVRGETVTLTATVAPEDADNKTLVWSSSDETVATVADGVVTTLKAGEAVITATATDGSNLSAACMVTVKPVLVSFITLDKFIAEVVRGETVTLTATVSPVDADNTALAWSSSDETVATVKDGVVTTLKAGEAVITATTTDGRNLSAACMVTVKPVLVSFITLDKFITEVVRGETVTLTATVSPVDADNTALVWSSSDEAVATVKDGVVTTLKVGEAVITATTTDGSDLSSSCTVVVKPLLVSSVTLDKQNAEVVRGESVTLTAIVAPEDADNKTLVWSSLDETVATVVDGVVKTLKAGEAVITATTTDGSNLSASCTVVAKPLLVSSVTLDKQNVEVVRGETVTLIATVSPEDADNKTLVWTSSDETVAAVKDGVVTTLKVGEAVITATTTDGSNLSASCTVVAKPLLVSSVTLDKQNVEVVRGETVSLTATVSPEDADNKTLVWTSSDETVATVKDGVVTALKVGEAVITATTTDGSNLSATCPVMVNPIVVSFITLDKQTAEVLRGETLELNVTFFPEDADNTAVVWKSSDETVATVTDGVVTALKSGRTVITVTTTDGTNLSSTCMVTVKPKYEILPAEVTLEIGETVQLIISDGENVLPASKFFWNSHDSKVAQVDQTTGLVTCIGEGFADVFAEAKDRSGSAICKIIAKSNSIGEVQVDKAVQVVYYSATGEASDVPHKGLNLVKRIYGDGRVEVKKEICK